MYMGAEWNLRDRDLGEVGKDSFITLQELQEMQLWSLGQEDPLEEEMAIHSSILAWRIPMDRGAWWTTVHRVTVSQAWLRDLAHPWICKAPRAFVQPDSEWEITDKIPAVVELKF